MLMANPVAHFEITGNGDGKALMEYYKNLFGWTVDANNPMNYGIVSTGDEHALGGGITGGEKPGVTIYVAVDEPQAYLDKAVALGGKVVMPVTVIPAMVTLAQFTDPDGNLIGIIKNE
jgi:predicted enzyme related to lactoylglutathione lyase